MATRPVGSTIDAAHRAAPRRLLVLAPLALAALAGCITEPDHDHHHNQDFRAPHPPVGVTSITADEAVYLSWLPNQESDLDGYRVYVSDDPYGPYELCGFTREAEYVHRHLHNGATYYYGVSAIDVHGNESDLNDEIIYDTPRPEGFGLVLWEADGDRPERSAFDFSRQARVHWDDPGADVFYDWASGTPFLAVPDYATDIQDAGFAGFDDITWAPDEGWSPSGFVEAIPGHVYVIWTRDNHYAKVRVIDVDGLSIEVDWAYQVDQGNPELRKAGVHRARPRPSAS